MSTMKNLDKPKLLLIASLFIIMLTLDTPNSHVMANVPTVLSIEPWMSGTDTIINITCTHASPSVSHYVDQLEVDKDGSIQVIPLTAQSTPTFLVQHNMGIIIDPPNVKARAHCTPHGWSGWSLPVAVPEFSSIFIPILLIALTTVILLTRSKLNKI